MTTIVVEEGKFISRRRKHGNFKDQKKQTLVTNIEKHCNVEPQFHPTKSTTTHP